jgi:lipopolysaccharide biosynthesis regulator YciM
MTNIFGSDTYLLIPVAGFYIIMALSISNVPKYTFYLFGLVFIYFVYGSYEVKKAWRSEKTLWEFAQKNEETPTVLKNLASIYYGEKQYAISFELSKKLWNWNPNLISADTLYAGSIYNSETLSESQKISLLTNALKSYPESSWINYFLASIAAERGEWENAVKQMNQIPVENYKFFADKASTISADYYFFCTKAKSQKPINCDQKIEQIKKVNEMLWRQKDFNQQLKVLNIKNHQNNPFGNTQKY